MHVESFDWNRMYAMMIRIDLHEICFARERGQAGRSLATELGA
jgi:hypothetical protein